MNTWAQVVDIASARQARDQLRDRTMTTEQQYLSIIGVGNILAEWRILYFQNILPMYHEDATEFFRALFGSEEVTIYLEWSELSELAVISCADWDGITRELFMREFVWLIRSDGGVSKKNIRESLWWLKGNNITASQEPNSVHHILRDITHDELEWYRPDKIDIVQWATRHTVIIMPESGDENLWSSFVIDFANPADCTLLDMILCAYDDVTTFNWVSLEDYYVHVQSASWNLQSTTLVFSPEQIQRIIYPKLREIYGDVSYEEAWKRYFRTRVIPKLRWK